MASATRLTARESRGAGEGKTRKGRRCRLRSRQEGRRLAGDDGRDQPSPGHHLMGRALIIPANPDAIFLPYQSRWITDNARLKLMEKGRQIGLSWSTAYATVSRTSLVAAKHDQWVSSRDDIQARLFLEDCKLWSGILDLAAQDLGEVALDPEGKHSAYVLRFANAKRIHSMSSNPDAQAGKRGSRVLDEFALHPDRESSGRSPIRASLGRQHGGHLHTSRLAQLLQSARPRSARERQSEEAQPSPSHA